MGEACAVVEMAIIMLLNTKNIGITYQISAKKIFVAQFSLLQRNFKVAALFRSEIYDIPCEIWE